MKQSSRPTLKAIAKQLGISVTTVSRALNGKAEAYGISKKTEEAVLRAANEMHFSPDPLARGLRLNRTLSIGLLIPDISNPYFAEIARNVEMAARREGYSVILCDSQESTQLEIESLALLRDRKVDGLVIAPVSYTHLRAHETVLDFVCRLLLEKKKLRVHESYSGSIIVIITVNIFY